MPPFDSFVVFAEMRTGSNFLETNINAFEGLACHGEAFNPHFIGYPNQADILGITQEMRDADPARLIDTIREFSGTPAAPVMGGFRFFNDHDPRALDIVLADPRCAKIILTRNPVESYVSRKIAAATGQWKLTNVTHAKSEKVRFDGAEFERHVAVLQAFQLKILQALQHSGQAAFYVDYEDLRDVAVMNGLAAWLGCASRIDSLDKKLKKQNPEPIADKVVNPEDLAAGLARLDRFNLTRTPYFEPRRGAAIPLYVAAPTTSLMYLPIRSGPEAAVCDWLSAIDGGGPLIEGFNHRSLRQWRIARPGHRSFTVLRHPVARAHAAFCERILASGPGSFPEIRQNLSRMFQLVLPDPADTTGHRAAFMVFLSFVRANLGGQTNLRVDPAWASQASIVQGFANSALPDLILREAEIGHDLPAMAGRMGHATPTVPAGMTDPHATLLAQVYDAEIEAVVRDIYARDYEAFGFADWPGQAA